MHPFRRCVGECANVLEPIHRSRPMPQSDTTASLAGHLGENMRALREARALTQAQMAKLAGLPRATWANLESGAGNPTLSVLQRVAAALQVSLEELVSRPRASARHVPK